MKDNTVIEVSGYIDELRENLQGIFTDVKYNYNVLDLDDDFDQEYIEGDEFYYDEEILTEEAQNEYEEYESFIIEKFNDLRKADFKQYKFLISLIYHDYCLSINDESKLELIFNSLIKTNSNFNQLDLFLQKNKIYYIDFLEGFLRFSEMTYFDKRSIFIDSDNIDKYLHNIFPLHYIDKLYYVLPYTNRTLILIFEKYQVKQFEELKEDAFYEIIDTITSLYECDAENYFDLMIPLLEEYYKYNSYEDNYNKLDDNNKKLMDKIKKEDLEPLLSDIAENDQFLQSIITEFYNYNYEYSEEYKNKVNTFYNTKKDKIKSKLKVLSND